MNKLIILAITTLFISSSFNANEINCTSSFNRSANGDGTNTYYFDCSCEATNCDGRTIKAQCHYKGNEITNQCKTVRPIPAYSGFKLQILNCIGNAAKVKVIDDGDVAVVDLDLKDCKFEGTAGRTCKGGKDY